MTESAIFIQEKMDSIVDTVLDIVSKCAVAAVRPGQNVESTIAGDLYPISQKSEDLNDDVCGICLGELSECTGEDDAERILREMKCPGSHKFHSQCLKNWLAQSKRGDCPVCRHNFYDIVSEDCESNLAHQIQPCPAVGFKCLWDKAYHQRVAALKILSFYKSSDMPFGDNFASALLWSLSEEPHSDDDSDDGMSDLLDYHLTDALEVLDPHLVWQYCVSLVKTFNVVKTETTDSGLLAIMCAMERVSDNQECCATLIYLGYFNMLLNCFKTCSSDDPCYYDVAESTMVNFVLHEELGPDLMIELLEAYKAACHTEIEFVRERFSNVISEIASTRVEGCIRLISGGACTALIEDLKASNGECNLYNLQTSQKKDLFTDMHYDSLTSAMFNLASTLDGCLAFVDAGACDLLIGTLRIIRRNVDDVPNDTTPTCNILGVINSISRQRWGRSALIAANACPELIAVLKNTGPIINIYRVAQTPDCRYHNVYHQIHEITTILHHLVQNKEGRKKLMKSDACSALVESLKNPDVVLKDEHIDNIASCMFRISCDNCGPLIDPLVEALHDANNDCARSRLSRVITVLYVKYGVGQLSVLFVPAHFVSAGPCGALVQAFKMAQSDSARSEIVGAICILSRTIKESRAGFVAAGAVSVLKDALKLCEQGLCSSIADIVSLLDDPGTGDAHLIKKRNTSEDI
jgi:hypothetical protein